MTKLIGFNEIIASLVQRIEALERRVQALEAERQEEMDARRNADMRMRGVIR